MKKAKINIMILILIILVIIVVLGILIYLNKNSSNNDPELRKQENEYIEVKNNPASIINGKKPQLVQYRNIYFTISTLVENYIKCVSNNDKEEIYNILDKDYIKENKITEENVLEKIEKYSKIEKSKIKDIYELSGSRYTTYYIEYNINDKDIYFAMNTDFTNKTFSIMPIKEQEYNKLLNTIIEDKYGEEKQIDINNFNKIIYENISEEQMAENLIQDYVTNALYYLEDSYNSLDEEYRKKRFANIENFREYIEDNKEILKKLDKSDIKIYSDFDNEKDYEKYVNELDKIHLSKYATQETLDGVEYMCIDELGNYYIFDTTAVMKYTLKLDTYTIESEKFKTEYNNGSIQRKAQLNIDKFIKMLNNKDYKNAYKILDDGFKNNYFKTEEDFKNYMKNNLFEYNNVSYEEFSQEDEINIYKIIVSDKTLKNDKKIKMNIIMQLKDGTDFVMSFGGAN